MAEMVNQEKALNADLQKVERESAAKTKMGIFK